MVAPLPIVRLVPPITISLAIPTPPSTTRAPVEELVLFVVFLILTLPALAAPMLIAVAAPAKFTVVALVLIRLKVVSSVERVAPFTARVPATIVFPLLLTSKITDVLSALLNIVILS